MPCYTRRTTTIDLNVADQKTLLNGLRVAKFIVNESTNGSLNIRNRQGVAAEIRNGQIKVTQGQEAIVNEVKRAYSHEVVRIASKRFGWTLTQDKTEPNKLTAGRRF